MLLFRKLIEETDYFIFEAYKLNSHHLGLYRLLYCAFIFVFYGIPNYSWLNNQVNYLFSPPDVSIANLFTGFPDGLFFTLASIGVAILYVVLFFGWKTKFTSLALFFLILFCQSFSMSFGKIDHNIIWLLIPLIMAFSGWGNTYSIDAMLQNKSKENAWPISMMALILGFAMFTASVPKILSGWLSFDSQSTLSHLVFNSLYWDREPLLLNKVLQIKSSFFWEFLDYITVVFEFGFLLVIFRPQVFRFFVLSAVVFHIFIYLTFSIVFTHNLLAYLLFINWSIFNPILKSAAFNRLVYLLFRLRNLAFCVSLVFLYGVSAILLHYRFILPSISGLVMDVINREESLRTFNTFILFAIALLIAAASMYKFLILDRQTHGYPALSSKLFRRKVL